MENKVKNNITFGEARREVNRKLSVAIFSILKENGCPDQTLSTIVEEQYGVPINTGEISKYRHHPDSTNIPTMVIAAFCKHYSISLEDLLHYEELTQAELAEQTKETPETQQIKEVLETEQAKESDPEPLNLYIPGGEGLVSSSHRKCFCGYWGEYFTYFMPTQSSETGFLKGTLTFKDENGMARAFYQLDTKQKNADGTPIYKKYEGSLVHSETMNCFYCILGSADVKELCFIMFRHFYLHHTHLECRLAEVLTAAAGGEDRYPTIHRMLISSQQIADQHVEQLLPMLCLTSSKILVSERELKELEQNENYKDIIQRILSNPELKPVPYYEIREDTIRTTVRDIHGGKLDEAARLCLAMRSKALAYRYNKVSKKADESVRELLRQWGYYNKEKHDE